MRLTGGEGKGRRLADAPPGVRPTSSRAKELLFQLLMSDLPDARVLDLFAGTGALGIEAIARGARGAVFVEKDRRALAAIRSNLKACRFEERAKVVPGDVLKLLRQPVRLDPPFGIILADPPYADPVFQDVMNAIREGNLLAPEGVVMFEAATRSILTMPEGWTETDTREVGDTTLHFFGLEDKR